MGLDMGLMSDMYLELKMGLKLKMYLGLDIGLISDLWLESDIWGMELRSEICLKLEYLKVDFSHKLEVFHLDLEIR